MSWNETIALQRIRRLISTSPEIDVKKFDDYLIAHNDLIEASKKEGLPEPKPLFELEDNQAIVVNTVQIYISIVNYDNYRLENDKETAASHARALKFLHFYYGITDRVAENSDAQRVDFHGSRVHVVTIQQEEPEIGNNKISPETIAKAFDFILKFKKVADAINREADNQFEAEFRIGIDVGTCVAINNGTGKEKEPMFLGSAANYAAKIAEKDEKPGIFVSKRLSKILKLPSDWSYEEFIEIDENQLGEFSGRLIENQFVYGSGAVETITSRLIENFKIDLLPELTKPEFHFKYKTPPLEDIDYSELYPSNSIRMPIVSMYADLSGYTNYVDECMNGNNISEAVKALYVIRSEFQCVVEEFFKGRKVRFIGDCIHALIAEGTESDIKSKESILASANCAVGINKSFNLCKNELEHLNRLGLAIGIEIGNTPISRIGIRGARSVRVASSGATIFSEMMQKKCEENGIIFGKYATKFAPFALKELIETVGLYENLHFDEVENCLTGTSESPSNTERRPHSTIVQSCKVNTKPLLNLR